MPDTTPDLPLPVIALVGAPDWAAQVSPPLAAHSFAPQRVPKRTGYINWLVDHYTVLVLIDADSTSGWAEWVTTTKTEQATRRIPVLVTGQDRALQTEAATVGADFFIPADELDEYLMPQVTARARILSPEAREELACQCGEPLPPLAQVGVRKFNAGAYYAQHDAFEEQWMAETGPVRELYRGILQVGVAYYHISKGNYNGGVKMLRRSVQWLATLPDVCQGVDVRQLRQDSAAVRAALEAMNPEDIRAFDRSLFKPVRWADSQDS
ncbi:MAG: DUF309 domain-containing protein [Chloroflexi bacterium]|nr:DUF309 domain-containing protein [Chloroflexota bacterium]